MKVCCAINNIFELNGDGVVDRLKKYIHLSDGQLNLSIGTEYVVYGVFFRDNSPWYYLCLDDDDEYPSPFPAELFKVLDARLSTHWGLSSILEDGGAVMSLLAFNEWNQDSMFYERLIDDDPQAIEVFQKYRSLMDQEYN